MGQTHTMMKAWFDRMLFPLTRPGRAVKALESSPPDRLQATVLHCMATQDLSSLRPDDQFSEALAAARTRLTAWFDEGDALRVQCRVSWRNECPDGCVLEHINMTLGQRMSVEWLKRQLVREATLRVAKTSSAERSELAACVMASEDVEVALGGCPLGDDAQMLQDLEVETIEASRKQEAEAEAEKQRRKEEQERKVREKAERRRTERQQRKAREDARRRHEAQKWDAAIRRRQQSIAFRNPVPIATVPCGY